MGTIFSATLPKTNIAPENRPSQEEMSSSNYPFSGAMLVSGRVTTTWVFVTFLGENPGNLQGRPLLCFFSASISGAISPYLQLVFWAHLVPSLKTNNLHLEMDGWKMIPFLLS